MNPEDRSTTVYVPPSRFSGMEIHSLLTLLLSFPLVTLRGHTAFIGAPALPCQPHVLSCSVCFILALIRDLAYS